jgi:hypothetical protein
MIEQPVQFACQSVSAAPDDEAECRSMKKRIKSAMMGNNAQQTAEQLVEQHGRHATTIAADRFLEHQRAGDGIGVEKWVEVMLAIRELTRGEDAGP